MRSLRSVTITIGISSTFKRKQWFPTMDHLPFSFPIKFSIQFSFLHFFFKSKHKLPSLITSTIVNRICLPFPLYKISTPLNLPAIEKIILHHFLIPLKFQNSECISIVSRLCGYRDRATGGRGRKARVEKRATFRPRSVHTPRLRSTSATARCLEQRWREGVRARG